MTAEKPKPAGTAPRSANPVAVGDEDRRRVAAPADFDVAALYMASRRRGRSARRR